MLKNLLYRSVYDEMSSDILDNILNKARKNNKEKNITGVLFVGSGFFMQTLEGEEEDIQEIFDKIKLDIRHNNVVIIGFSDLKKRRFENWSMACINTEIISDFYLKKVEKFSSYTEDDNIEGEMCDLFLDIVNNKM